MKPDRVNEFGRQFESRVWIFGVVLVGAIVLLILRTWMLAT